MKQKKSSAKKELTLPEALRLSVKNPAKRWQETQTTGALTSDTETSEIKNKHQDKPAQTYRIYMFNSGGKILTLKEIIENHKKYIRERKNENKM